jgi:hypothetical protein
VILTSTGSQIEGFWITAYKGIVQGQTWDEFLRNAEAMGANAVLNTCFDDALDVDTLFHGAGVVLKRSDCPSLRPQVPPRLKPRSQAMPRGTDDRRDHSNG